METLDIVQTETDLKEFEVIGFNFQRQIFCFFRLPVSFLAPSLSFIFVFFLLSANAGSFMEKNKPLVIGVSIGAALFILLCCYCCIKCRMKKKRKKDQEKQKLKGSKESKKMKRIQPSKSERKAMVSFQFSIVCYIFAYAFIYWLFAANA